MTAAATTLVQIADLPVQRVAIMGVVASFHHRAAQLCLGPGVETVSCSSFTEVLDALEAGRADVAVMAVENTLVGLMLPNLHQVVHRGLHILGEHYMQIELQLLALPGATLEQIDTVYCHPYGFQQCEPFLAQHPGWKRVEASDTATGAATVKEKQDPRRAAIASSYVGEHFGLQPLVHNVHSHSENFTRFLVLGRSGHIAEPNKATFWFRVPHTPGALAHVLQVFALHNLNLTKLTSIVVPEHPNDFAFLVEFIFDTYSHYQLALEVIRPKVIELNILGEYVASPFAPFNRF